MTVFPEGLCVPVFGAQQLPTLTVQVWALTFVSRLCFTESVFLPQLSARIGASRDMAETR